MAFGLRSLSRFFAGFSVFCDHKLSRLLNRGSFECKYSVKRRV